MARIVSFAEQTRRIRTHFLNRSRLLLIRLQNLEESLVRLGIVGEAVLDLVDVVDRMVEFHDGRLLIILGDALVLLRSTGMRRVVGVGIDARGSSLRWWRAGGRSSDTCASLRFVQAGRLKLRGSGVGKRREMGLGEGRHGGRRSGLRRRLGRRVDHRSGFEGLG